MQAVILAGGKGRRLAPYTTVLPKPLMPIGDMPILEVILRQLKRAGITEVKMAVGYLAEIMQAFFADGKRLGLKIDYSLEEKPLGTAGPLSLIKDLSSPFIVMNGDILTDLDFRNLISYHQDKNAIATVATYKRHVKIDFGVIETDNDNNLTGYIEKPSFDYRVSMGIYVFDKEVLSYIPYNEYLDFPDLVLKLLADNKKIVSYPFNGYWLDIGRPDDYAIAIEEFDKKRKMFLPDE